MTLSLFPVSHLDYYQRTLRTPRYQQSKRVVSKGWKTYSQNDEDGIIDEIFRRIGAKSKRFVEIGVHTGLECNSLLLLSTGWLGLWIEENTKCAAKIEERFGKFLRNRLLACQNLRVTAENINELVREYSTEIDLLSIDIDYNDYWVWKALDAVQARVVVVEYNASFPPPLSLTVPYEPNHDWDGTNYFGASLSALEKLGREKGYSLVGCCFSGVNAFFVRDDLTGDHFCEPYTADNHYEPPRYFLKYPSGHPPGVGLFVNV